MTNLRESVARRSTPFVRHVAEARVPGMVFVLTDVEFAQADKYEPAECERVLADLESGEKAWVYVEVGERSSSLESGEASSPLR